MNFMDKWAAPIAGAIMIIVVMVVISGFTPTRSLFCREDEICLREWLTATSGWAAALAAFVTLFALRRQVAAQEKQIDHQLGNVEPDMMVRCTVGEYFPIQFHCRKRIVNDRHWSGFSDRQKLINIHSPNCTDWREFRIKKMCPPVPLRP